MYSEEWKIEELAELQASRFTRAQVAELADNPGALVQRRLRNRAWRRQTSRVLALAGAPKGPVGEIWTAHLHVGSDTVVSHHSAAVLHGFPGVPAAAPTLTLPDGCHRRYAAGRLLQRGDLDAMDLCIVDGRAVTNVARTLADLSPELSRPRLDALIDHAVQERLVTMTQLRAVLDRLLRPGKLGLEPLTDLVADRLPGDAVEQTRLERELTWVVRLAGLTDGVAQFPAPGRPGDPTGFVDRAWPELRWIVEADGRRWHERQRTMRSDRARDRAASSLGWLITRFTYDDLVRAAEASADDLRAIHAQRIIDVGRPG